METGIIVRGLTILIMEVQIMEEEAGNITEITTAPTTHRTLKDR